MNKAQVSLGRMSNWKRAFLFSVFTTMAVDPAPVQAALTADIPPPVEIAMNGPMTPPVQASKRRSLPKYNMRTTAANVPAGTTSRSRAGKSSVISDEASIAGAPSHAQEPNGVRAYDTMMQSDPTSRAMGFAAIVPPADTNEADRMAPGVSSAGGTMVHPDGASPTARDTSSGTLVSSDTDANTSSTAASTPAETPNAQSSASDPAPSQAAAQNSANARSLPMLTQTSGVSSTLGNRIVSAATALIGSPYQWGGVTPSGFDCSGFVQFAVERAGVSLPRTTWEQYDAGRPVSESQLLPGDLVFFSTDAPGPSHVGIYIGGGQFIHADSERGVTRASMRLAYWANAFVGARRLSP